MRFASTLVVLPNLIAGGGLATKKMMVKYLAAWKPLEGPPTSADGAGAGSGKIVMIDGAIDGAGAISLG